MGAFSMAALIVRAQRLIAPFLPCAILAMLLVAACGGDAPPPGGTPTASPDPAIPEATRFYQPSQQRTVTPLVGLPTRTPVGMARPAGLPGAADTAPRRIAAGATPAAAPTATPRPPRVLDPEHTPGPPAYAVPDEIVDRVWVLEPASCFEDFFNRAAGYDGPEAFGPEALQALSDDMLASREDCVMEGWSPQFAVGPVPPCDQARTIGGRYSHNGYPLPMVFKVRKGKGEVMGPTAAYAGSRGFFLIHFDKLPYSGGSGCWFGGGGSAWLHFSGLSPDGEYVYSESSRSFPGCESALRGVIEDFRNDGRILDFEAVMEAKALVMDAVPEVCGELWLLTPSGTGTAGCRWEGDTGPVGDGGFLLNWNMTPFSSGDDVVTDSKGGSPCWFLSGEGEWLYSAPLDLPAIEYALGRAVP